MSESAVAEVSAQEVSEPQETSEESVLQSQQENVENQEGEAVPPQETKQEKARRLAKFKSNGKDHEYDLDDDNQLQELIKKAQLGDGAQAKMQEAANIRKMYENIEKLIKDNPEELLKRYDKDPIKMAEEILQRQIAEMEKSPEQKEREQLQKELAEERKKLKEIEENQKQAELLRLQESYAHQIEEDITSALDEYKDLPKSPYVVKRIAEGLLYATENGYDKVQVKDIVPIIHEEIRTELQNLFEQLPEDSLETLLGQKVLEKMRKNRINKHKTNPVESVNSIKTTGNNMNVNQSKVDKKIPLKDFLRGK